ncbi:UNVERIFIED_CONTAM: hypothetical protein Sradi_5064800 [Sesamum radiatum]|uniref:Rhamnogalacturonan lyase domain-containing protein n=1 Tax=Sesamum radiatum TaxID=300843 RepID=A0AAW2M372_SESRA
MVRGSSGFYSYGIYQHQEDMPAFNLNETRIAFMLRKDKFKYVAVTNDRQRRVPLPEDRVPPRGKELAFPEAVLLVDPLEPEFKGEVDDKYQYSCENKDNKVHGFICFEPPVGFWQITPSNEFRTGGPSKQDLTSHVNPTTLAMFVSTHYGGEDLVIKFGEGEEWKKVFGPVFIYLNSCADDKNDAVSLWYDAKDQMEKEVGKWPYSFPASEDFPHADQRGSEIDVGDLVYAPPRNGPTLWEIGVPDRSAAEFFVPDPNPMYINKLYINLPNDRFRQYGLWERYADLYPDEDLVYTVGISDYHKDWFYAQVTRKIGENAYQGTTWQIKFNLDGVREGNHTLRIALASATFSILEVRINREEANPPEFSSGLIGSDNTIARHGLHGLYWLFNLEIQSSKLIQGQNTIYLTQARSASAVHGIMYDYIRFEGPPLHDYSASQIKA